MGSTFARALPRAADATISTTGGGPLRAGLGALDTVSTTATTTSTSPSSSPTSTNKDGSPGDVSVEVWAPLVGIVAVIALMTVYTCFRKNNMNASMIAATRLANDTAANNSSRTGGGTAGGRRRPRRTPSQISTRSLPAYMQDPGDQEIVLARGRLRRNRSRPNMPGETDDEYDSGDEDEEDGMDGQDRSLSQSDRPLLASSGTLATGSEPGGLAPPERYSTRTGTSFDTMRLGSEDSQHALLRDEPEDMDHHEGGTTYVFGEGTTGGQLYDERDNVEEHVEMRQLNGGGVSMGSASSSSSAGSVSGSRPAQQHDTSSSSPTTTPQPKHGFFSTLSSILGNSLSSVAHSLSGMNASISGTALGGGSYNTIGDRPQQWGPRGDAPPPSSDGAAGVRRQNTDTTLDSVNTFQSSNSGSALLAPPPSQLPPPYEGNNTRSSMETTTTTSRPRSQSRSSARRPTPFSRSRSRSGSNTNPSTNANNPSASTFSLDNNNTSAASHIRSPSATSLSISAPLAHTVTRSAFMYPASGPTTDQIKFLSSREALGRFGMPYGHQAVAAAARARVVSPTNGLSQGDHEAPPPSFEDIAGGGSSSNIDGGVLSLSTTTSSTSTTSQIPSAEPTQSTTSPISSPSEPKKSPTSVRSSSQYGPKRTDSVASRTSSIRSNRSIAGPRGPRTSVRRSTLPAGGVVGEEDDIDRERTPRPSMDSIDTIDSIGIEMKRRDHSALEQMEDMAFWATAAERVATGGDQPSTSTSTQPPRRSTLQSLPKLVVDNTSTQQSILPTTVPRGFVMSSPPASPTPATSTNPHANAFNNELGVPVITFAPATPSVDSHGHGHVG